MENVFENDVVSVREVCYFLQNDEYGNLYIAHFEDEEAYELFLEVQGSCVEIFSESCYVTTRKVLTAAMNLGTQISRLISQKQRQLVTS